jgi:hypothetical protein
MEQVEIFEKLSVVEAKNRKAHDMDFVRNPPPPCECTHFLQIHWILAHKEFLTNQMRVEDGPSKSPVQNSAREYSVAQPLQHPVVIRKCVHQVNFDTDEDARVSLAEWNAGLFHEKPQKPAFSDGASFGLVDTSVKRKPMVIDGKIVSPTGAVYYTASDATWVEVEKYCASRQHVLCPLESTCPHTSVAGPWHGGLHTWVDKDAAEGRWMPLQGKEHTWVELKTCGLARFRDDRAHPGLIACCDSEGNPMEIDDAAKERIQKEAVAKAAAAERMAEDAFAEAWEDSSVVGLGNEEKIKKTAEGTEEKKEKKASKNDETAAAAAAAAAAADVQRGAEDGEGGETVEEKKVGAGPKVEDQAKASTAGKIEIQKDGPGDGETGGTAGGVDGAGGSAMDADKQLQREMEMLKKARKARKEKEQAASGGATGTEGGGKKKKDKKKKKKKAAQAQAL